MNNRSNPEKTDKIGYQDGIDYIKPTEETEKDIVDSFGLPEYDDESRLGWRPNDITTPTDLYRDGDPYISKTIAEDSIEELRPIYLQRDRVLSEKQIRENAENRGISIIDFDDYLEKNNIQRIEKCQPKDSIKSIENYSPEQCAKLAKLALALINAVEILEYAHMSTGNISTEAEAYKYIKQAIILQRDLNGEEYDEAAVEAAIPSFKDELVYKYIGPNNTQAHDLFLEKYKKIKDDYDQEVKDSLKKNPNYNGKKWHKN